MTSLLLTNIKSLLQVRNTAPHKLAGAQMAELPAIDKAYLLVEGDKVAAYGPMSECPERADEVVDCSGKLVLPSWVDSHTHLVFAASREEEFVYRIKGLSYQEIAAKGGGILNSARKLQTMDESELYEGALKRLNEVMALGTGAIEIKSGYGLTKEAELKMLRIIRRLKEEQPIPIKATFLGAHALPPEYKPNRLAYIDLLIDELLPQIADEGLADYIDCFCETNYFRVDEMERLLEAGAKYGLKGKVHVNQFTAIGGIAKAVEHGALSVDHLEVVTDEDIEALKGSQTMATLLPSCSFFINIPFAPARQLIDNGLAVALASDYNPGTTPTGNMNLVVAMGCIRQKMLPEEAVNAATINGAYAIDLQEEVGSISVDKQANFIVTKPVPGLAYLPYAFGSNLIDTVYLGGRKI